MDIKDNKKNGFKFEYDFEFIKGVLINMLILITLSLVILATTISYGSEVKKTFYDYQLATNFNNKNLSLPFEEYPLGIVVGTNQYETNIDEFHNQIIRNYKYSDVYDCKYWAFIWGYYFWKNGIKYEYLMTDNHIFVMAHLDNGYYIADENKLIKTTAYLE